MNPDAWLHELIHGASSMTIEGQGTAMRWTPRPVLVPHPTTTPPGWLRPTHALEAA